MGEEPGMDMSGTGLRTLGTGPEMVGTEEAPFPDPSPFYWKIYSISCANLSQG